MVGNHRIDLASRTTVMAKLMEIHLVPTLLGSGERLFDGVGDDLLGLELVRTVAAPNLTHLKFAKRLHQEIL